MSANRHPNVVFIICDDLAYGDLACHGNPYTRTPNLDRLHSESVRLTRYGSGPLCTPARAAVMTGRHPYRTGAFDTYIGRSMMHTDEITIAKLLRGAGYATGMSGKWHLGDNYPMRPMEQGFDHAFYHCSGGISQPGNRDWPSQDRERSYFDSYLMRDGEPVRGEGYCTDVFTDDAIAFMREHRDAPFFSYIGYNAPHVPLQIEDKWAQPYLEQGLPEPFARLYGMVENIDMNVGRIMQALDELGIADDTILVFTSDHGPCPGAMHDGESRWNAGLRDLKGSLYEGGIRVPCLVRYPAGFLQAKDVDRIANPIDWLATFSTLGGYELPSDRVIDGVDLSPLLRGEVDASNWPEREIVMQWHRGDLPRREHNCAVIGQRYKWIIPTVTRLQEIKHDKQPELYDLETDFGEQHNLADEMPDLCERMRATYHAWFDDVCSTRGECAEENFAPPAIVVGSERENPTLLSQQDWRSLSREGWAKVTDRGYWSVEVVGDGSFDITMDGRELDVEGDVVWSLICGGQEHRVKLDRSQTQAELQAISLPTGRFRIEAQRTVGGETFGVDNVWLHQR